MKARAQYDRKDLFYSRQYMDLNDPACLHLRRKALSGEGDPCFHVYAKQVKSAFHKWGHRAPLVLRLYYIASLAYPGKRTFDINHFIDTLSRYGYKKSRQLKKDTLSLLRHAPQWFTEVAPGQFSFKSWRRIVGVKRLNNEFVQLDREILEKRKHSLFVDTLLRLQAAGQITAAQNITNQTGYSRSRFFQAIKNTERLKVRCLVMETTNRQDALAERVRLLLNGIFSEVYETEGKYILTVTTGLSFPSIDRAEATGDPAKAEKDQTRAASEVQGEIRRTTVFFTRKGEIRTMKNAVSRKFERFQYAEFVDLEAGDAFLSRHKDAFIRIRHSYAA